MAINEYIDDQALMDAAQEGEEETKEESKFSSLEVMARLTDTNIEATEICEKFLLITYDIPKTEAGDQARREFLAKAKLIGAVAHTDSVYLMPWTADAESIALGLAKIGKVCVWTSQTTDNLQAVEVTRNYDAGLVNQITEITERLDKIEGYIMLEQPKRAYRMIAKTDLMVEEMDKAIMRRNSAVLYVRFMVVKARYQSLARNVW